MTNIILHLLTVHSRLLSKHTLRMHATLQELRLTQRALRSSCRSCSARCQSPRRSFHRGPPLRNSQEPGNNAGSNTAPASTDSKHAADKKSSVANNSNPSTTSYLPHTAPSVRNDTTASDSEQTATSNFYGSSWNRRQRVKAQQTPSEPPFVAPQWFHDHNVTLWGQDALATDPNSHIRFLDEYEAETLSHGPPESGRGPTGPAVPLSGIKSKHGADALDPGEDAPVEPQETAQETVKDSIAEEPRYYVGAHQWDELLTTTRGLLSGATNQQYQGDPAARATNLIIHYAGKNGEYLLDEVVLDLASHTQSDLLTLDVQDVAELISHAGFASKDPSSASEGRMLSYDLLADQPLDPLSTNNERQPEPAAEEEDDGFDESDPFEMPNIPGLGNNAGQPMMLGKPFTFMINVGNSSGDQSGGPRQTPSALSKLLSNRSSEGSQFPNFLQSSTIPLRNVVEGLLLAVPSKKLAAVSSQSTADDQTLPKKSTIVHVKDIKGIQNAFVGAQFLTNLYALVESRRSNGESIMIIGTEGPKDSKAYTSHKIESVQRTPEVNDISRTIVLAPLLPNQQASSNLIEDQKRRTATINLRHLWEMMRVSSTKDFLGLVPGFWHRNVYNELTEVDQPRLSNHVWSFQQVHRYATYISGIQDQDSFVGTDDREDGKILPLINSVGRKLTLSDSSKLAWAEKIAAHDRFERSIERDANGKRIFRPRDKSKSKTKFSVKYDKIRSGATKHEKKLMGGIIEPAKIRTSFKDVHVPAETIDTLQTLTMLSLLRPEAFKYGVLASDKIPGLLLYGPPGTGKTLLAKAVAKESGATMLEVSAADLNDMYVGEGEKNVQALFTLARKLSPCIIFLDEADAMFSARSAAGRRVSHRELLNQFLKEWDGMSNDSGSAFLMVATNRPMDFDDAILRRLPRRLLVDLPTESDRQEILKIHLKSEKLAEDVDLAALAKQTPFYSGSDLKNLCVAAALNAVRQETSSLAKRKDPEEVEKTHPHLSVEEKIDMKARILLEQEAPYPAVRTIVGEHFKKALEEITASVSEDMNSLKEIKKFDDVYGDKKGRKRKQPKWGFRTAGEAERKLDTVKVRE